VTRRAPSLYVVGDRGAFESDEDWIEALDEVATNLIPDEAMQVRVKNAAGCRRVLLERAREVTRHSRGVVLMNGTTAESEAYGYEGVHWPEALIDGAGAPPAAVLAASVHSLEALQQAEDAGVDFVVAGAVFTPGSPAGDGHGIAWLCEIVRAAGVPVVAIGGIDPARVPVCRDAGAAGVAVVTGVMLAGDRAEALRRYRRALEREAAGGWR
jgi:thiamine monophosphate synthase